MWKVRFFMFRLFGLLLFGLVLAGCQTTETTKVDDQVTKDLAASSMLRDKLISDSDIRSSQYRIEVKDGVLEIYGLARSKSEMNKVITYATSVRFVKEVISYIKFEDDADPSSGS